MAFVDDCLTTGKKVKQLREAKGFSQEHLAELVDVQRNTISNIERGVSDPGFQLMVKIANALGTTPTYFAPDEYGFGYVKALAKSFYGIEDIRLIKAVGLDIDGADVEGIMEKAISEIEKLF